MDYVRAWYKANVVLGGVPLEQRLREMTADVRAYDAVAVVGAGMSAYGYPMTKELPALLWRAIDEVEGAVVELARRVGRDGSPKAILGTDRESVGPGWQLARDMPQVRVAFQRAFANLDADRDPSLAHEHLARLVHDGKVELVVSYNWDTCLERAHQQIYGVPIRAGVLRKPHGDALTPNGDWVFPDEDGRVPHAVLERLVELDDRPHTLLVLGYSGSDPNVVSTLLDPLRNRWPVYQISPSAQSPHGVSTTADHATGVLVDSLLEPLGSQGWRHVAFNRSRPFSAALRSERLREVDVASCPELPYAKPLAERLIATRFATLSGKSGTGKSITAFHAALRLNKAGWGVVALNRPAEANSDQVAAYARMPGPVLAVVDDAQAIDPRVISDFESVVDNDHAVLLISTERLEDYNDETVSEERAKDAIFEYCITHLEEVGPLLIELDSRVGYGMGRESPANRLRAAQVSAHDPWALMFVASGGEERMSTNLERLAEHSAAAVLLAAIASSQMMSQDAGMSPDDVALAVAEVMPEAFGPANADLDPAKFTAALEAIRAERLIRENDGLIRTPHIRVAQRALKDLVRRDDEIGSRARDLVRGQLLDTSQGLLGKFWLVQSLSRNDAMRHKFKQDWLDAQTVDALVQQAAAAAQGRDRSLAGLLIGDLSSAKALERAQWKTFAAQAVTWLPKLEAEEVQGFSRMLMHLREEQPDLNAQLRASLPARDLGAILSSRGTRASGGSWADLLRELSPSPAEGDIAALAWSADLTQGIDHDALCAWLSAVDETSHNDEVYELVDVLAAFAPSAARSALRACAEHMTASFESDMADASRGMARWVFGNMNLVAHVAAAIDTGDGGIPAAGVVDDEETRENVEDRWVPPPEFVDLARTTLEVMRSVDWRRAGASLVSSVRHEIESLDLLLAWLGWLSPDLVDEVAEVVEFEWLDTLAAPDDRTGQGELAAVSGDGTTGAGCGGIRTVGRASHLLGLLAVGERGKARIEAYMDRHAGSLTELQPPLVVALPELAARMLRAGHAVCLEGPHRGGWTQDAQALEAVANVDPDAAALLLRKSAPVLKGALQSPQPHNVLGLARFVTVADTLDPGVLEGLLVALDPSTWEASWRSRLADAPPAGSVHDAKALVERAAHLDGPLGDAARRLTNV